MLRDVVTVPGTPEAGTPDRHLDGIEVRVRLRRQRGREVGDRLPVRERPVGFEQAHEDDRMSWGLAAQGLQRRDASAPLAALLLQFRADQVDGERRLGQLCLRLVEYAVTLLVPVPCIGSPGRAQVVGERGIAFLRRLEQDLFGVAPALFRQEHGALHGPRADGRVAASAHPACQPYAAGPGASNQRTRDGNSQPQCDECP